MATFTEVHGLSLAENSFIENFNVEILLLDPAVLEAGRVWYNSTEKTYKASTYDAGGAVVIIVLGGKEQLDAYILDMASQVRGNGSALVGYAGKAGVNFSVAAGTAELSLDALVGGIDANAQALIDLGTGTLTNLQNELDATQVGAGLEVDGSLLAPIGTYISTAANLKSASELLDIQAKANADAIIAEQAARAAADDLKVNKAGDAMTGDLSLGGNRITNVGAPIDDTDATNKVYVDNAISGISWKQPVKAATTVDIVLSGEQTIDGIVLVAGDRVLVKDQVLLVDNGIYDVSLTAWIRSADFDDSVDTEVEEGAAVFVEDGILNADNGFTLMGTNTDLVAGLQVGSDNLEFIQFSGAGQVIAGAGISKLGNELFINFGAGIAELPSDEVGIETLATGSLFTTVDGVTESVAAAATLAIKLDSTTLTSSANGLKITDTVLSGITSDIAIVQNELDATQIGAGLNIDGGLTIAGNYVGTSASLKVAITDLDAQVKTNTDGLATELTNRAAADTLIQNELDVTQVGAGLGITGTYAAALSANYINGATSLFNAEVLLDTQVKTVADGLAQEVIDRTAAVSGLTTTINNGKFTFESALPTTSHTILHGLGDAFVTVGLWIKQADGLYKNDIGQITLDTNNQLTVDLTVAKDIRVIVTAGSDLV